MGRFTSDPVTSASTAIIATIISVKALQETVKRYKSRNKTLGRLNGSLLDLVTVLNSLEAVANNETPVLTLLKGPIDRCAQVCRKFEAAIEIFSGKSQIGFEDWTKMEFMKGDISEFIDNLSDCKSIITIGVGAIAMHASKLAQQDIGDYREMIKDTAYNLEMRLRRIDEKLINDALDFSTLSEDSNIDLQGERAATIQCLRICGRASSYIGSLQREAPQQSATYASDQLDAQLLTQKALKESQGMFLETIGRLQERIDSINFNRPSKGGSEMDSNSPKFPGVLSNDTDVETLFSKDSGYSSLVSKKAHQSNPDNGQEIHDSAKWESKSVASVGSLATMNTISSVNPTAAGGAAVEFAEMLIKDESICGSIKDGYKNLESKRFERNLRRILKKFAFSLRREARNDLEKSAVRLVHNYRAFVVIYIKKYLELPDDRHVTSLHELRKQKQSQLALERYLETIPGVEGINTEYQLDQNQSGSDVDSDLSNDEQPYLPTLEKVKSYLLSSTAYSALKQQLAEFVRPPCITCHLPSGKSALTDMDLRSNKAVNMEEGELMTKESEILGPTSDAESDANFPQFRSSSIDDVETVWNAVLDTPQQIEKERLRGFDMEEPPLKMWKLKHGRLENVLLLRKLCATISLTHISLTLQNQWAKWRRRPVAKGRSRIEWKCACGHDLFADFNNKSLDTVNKYTAILQRPPNGNSHSIASQHSTNHLTSPPTAHLQPNSSSILVQPSQGLNSLPPISASQNLSLAANNESDLSFLELCVNTGPHLKSLAEIDTVNILTDGALFQAIRKHYHNLRGFRSRFWLLKPAAISFVRFSLENRHRVGILQKPLALPPKSEVDAKNWVYDPCPLEGDPPIAEDLFLHYLQCSEGSGTLFWMLRFPRRLEASLLKSAALATFGWGIHIDEGPNFAALFKANFFVLVLSGVAAGLWKFFEHDFQGAFGFACWIVAVLNSLLMACIFKWKQE